MPLPLLHETDQRALRIALDKWNLAAHLGVADGAVLADTDIAALQADLDALDLHADLRRARQKIIDQLRLASELGTLTDPSIVSADTVQGIRDVLTGDLPGSFALGAGSGALALTGSDATLTVTTAPSIAEWLLETGVGRWLLEDGTGTWRLEAA